MRAHHAPAAMLLVLLCDSDAGGVAAERRPARSNIVGGFVGAKSAHQRRFCARARRTHNPVRRNAESHSQVGYPTPAYGRYEPGALDVGG